MRESTQQHWQDFWEEADQLELDEVYGTDGRLVREILGLGDPAGIRVLEVGAGTGRDAVALAKAGAQVCTIDYVVGSLDLTVQASRQQEVKLAPVGGDGLRMPFADGSFDVVFHQGLLEHFRDPNPLLAENVRILKPGGCLVVDVPQKYHYYTVAKQILIKLGKWFAGWETQFSPGELETVVGAHGVAVERTYGDWMLPGMWYRGLRKVLLTKTGLRLPMFPKPVPLLSPLAAAWRRWFARRRLSLYTTPTIGVVARKPDGGETPEALS